MHVSRCAAPADYDGWAQLGNAGGASRTCCPSLASSRAMPTSWTSGMAPAARCRFAAPPPAEVNPVHQAFVVAAGSIGLAHVEDHNRPGAVGVGLLPRTDRNGLRMSTAVTYLAGARGRPNLTIRSDAMVDRVVVRSGRATGVRLVSGEIVDANRVVVAAGAYASPAILQRSGVGPAQVLAEFGIGVVVEDLPGVGENLVDHPLCAVDLVTRAERPAHVFRRLRPCAPAQPRHVEHRTCTCSQPALSMCRPTSARRVASSGWWSGLCSRVPTAE